MDFRKWDGTWRTERDWNMNNRTQKHYGSWILENGVWNMENRKRFEHEQQNLIRTWTTEQTWNKDTGTGLKHEKTDQVCSKDARTGLEPGEYGEHDSFRTKTRLEYRKQKKIGTWKTEENWNKENWEKDTDQGLIKDTRTGFEPGERQVLNKDYRIRLEQRKQKV